LIGIELNCVGWLARGSCIRSWWLAITRSRDFQELCYAVSSRTRPCSLPFLTWYQRRREGVLYASFYSLHSIQFYTFPAFYLLSFL